MAKTQSVQSAVVGELLPDVSRRSAALAGARYPGLLGEGARKMAGLERNLSYVPQSVVKRVAAGGTHNPKELRRQMEYITRDEANVASWSNQIGVERSFDDGGIDRVVAEWSQSWLGKPKRGHTDHIILSFPKGTEAATAEGIAREWGQEVFGSGHYEDRFRYVAAMHHNTEQVHAHFIVEKVGMEHGKFLSINKFSDINYDMMRELHADIAADYGLALNATPRLSRGLIENPPRQVDVQAARQEDREPYAEPISFLERAKREAVIRGYAVKYEALAEIASMHEGHKADSYLSRLIKGAQSAAADAYEGNLKMNDFASPSNVPAASMDATGRIVAAREAMIAEAQGAWTSIQEMEPGQERVDMERAFADQATKTAHLFPENDFLRSHSEGVDRGSDSYHLGTVGALEARAADEASPLAAEADRALGNIREALAEQFAPHEDRLAEAGTSAEEMAARFTSSGRTEGQLEEWRPNDPFDRRDWMELERQMQAEGAHIVGSVSLGRELQEEVAREELLGSRAGERLADIQALEKLVHEVRADLSDGDLDRVASGSLDPLMDQIRDPGVRSAVASELKNVAAVADGHDASGRDSELADRYRDITEAHERALERQGRGREDLDRDLSL